jgi:hypothetical protein
MLNNTGKYWLVNGFVSSYIVDISSTLHSVVYVTSRFYTIAITMLPKRCPQDDFPLYFYMHMHIFEYGASSDTFRQNMLKLRCYS